MEPGADGLAFIGNVELSFWKEANENAHWIWSGRLTKMYPKSSIRRRETIKWLEFF